MSFVAVEEAIQEEYEHASLPFHLQHQPPPKQDRNYISNETSSDQKLNQLPTNHSIGYDAAARWRMRPKSNNSWFDDKVRDFLDSCELDTICQESNIYRVKSKASFNNRLI